MNDALRRLGLKITVEVVKLTGQRQTGSRHTTLGPYDPVYEELRALEAVKATILSLLKEQKEEDERIAKRKAEKGTNRKRRLTRKEKLLFENLGTSATLPTLRDETPTPTPEK